jgi:DNA polymerase III alpha subunit (gram-positive type)
MEERIRQRIVELEAIEQQHLEQLRAIRTVLIELRALLEGPIMSEGSEAAEDAKLGAEASRNRHKYRTDQLSQ